MNRCATGTTVWVVFMLDTRDEVLHPRICGIYTTRKSAKSAASRAAQGERPFFRGSDVGRRGDVWYAGPIEFYFEQWEVCGQ